MMQIERLPFGRDIDELAQIELLEKRKIGREKIYACYFEITLNKTKLGSFFQLRWSTLRRADNKTRLQTNRH
jgi:hypothetical protein